MTNRGYSRLNPNKLAALYYFGDIQYWKLPSLAVEALAHRYDGAAHRRLAGLSSSTEPAKTIVESDMTSEQIAAAFQEMGVVAPLSRTDAGLSLAAESAKRAINGDGKVLDETTHIRMHICWGQSIPELRQIAGLSLQAKRAPQSEWLAIEEKLRAAMSVFRASRR